MDVLSVASVDGAIQRIVTECGRLDVVVHNAGHLTVGPTEAFTTEAFTTEAFTTEEIADLFDTNV